MHDDTVQRPGLTTTALDVARSALPTIAALAVIVAADALLDGWLAAVVVLGTLAALVAVVSRLERGAVRPSPDARGDGVRDAARAAPLVVAVAVYVLTGLDSLILAGTYVATWIVTQTLLAWRTHRPTRPRPG